METNYTPLEPSFTSSIGLPSATFQPGQVVSLLTSTTFIYNLLLIACIAAAGFVYAKGGMLRLQASGAGIQKSNEEFKRGTLGLLGVLSLFLILYTVNRGLLLGDVGLEALRTSTLSNNIGVVSTGSGSSTSKACESTNNVIAALQSQSGLCGNTQCLSLSGCDYQKYLPLIKQEASRQGVDYKMVVVTMCKESRADKNAQGRNQDGTYDCGLMQINQKTPCSGAVLDPATNIATGVSTLKSALGSARRVYTGIPGIAGAFASYNCCSNGTIPNAESVDCTTASGFKNPVPKWACPINPGDSSSNMCAVKNYACDLTACLDSL